MAYFYPQASITMRVIWEDYKLTSNAALQEVYTLPVMTKSVTVTINDYTSADTFEAEIDYKSFPFDPRAIRAMGVTIHMQDVGHLFQGNNALNALQKTVSNTVFIGYADEESISFDDDSRTVRIEGRDLTALLIDRRYFGGPIPLTDRLDVTIQNLLNQLTETAVQTSGLRVELRGVNESELPVLANFMKADGDHNLNGKKNVDRDENYWEVIQDIIARAGLICFIELDKLVISKPRALYNANQAKVFVYGSNISNLKLKRKIGRKKNFNVIVRSLAGKEVIEAKIPLEATAEWSKETGISLGEVKLPEIGPKGEIVEKEKWKPAPYMSFRIPNCKDKDHLIRAAQEIYEEVGRQQIEGSFETRDMKVLEGLKPRDRSLFDVLKMRNGTPIQVLVDQGDMRGLSNVQVNEKGELIKDATIEKRKRFLIERGYEPSVALAFAQSMDQFVNIFYTKSVRFSIDNDNGFKADIEFLNFIDTKASTGK